MPGETFVIPPCAKCGTDALVAFIGNKGLYPYCENHLPDVVSYMKTMVEQGTLVKDAQRQRDEASADVVRVGTAATVLINARDAEIAALKADVERLTAVLHGDDSIRDDVVRVARLTCTGTVGLGPLRDALSKLDPPKKEP